MTNIIVQYGDQENITRWGYVTYTDFLTFDEYQSKLRKLSDDQNNEVLKADVKQTSEIVVRVYLPDGTTGDAELRALAVVEKFAQYPPQQAQIDFKQLEKQLEARIQKPSDDREGCRDQVELDKLAKM